MTIPPSAARLEFLEAGFIRDAIPTRRQITRSRIRANATHRVQASGESVAELRSLMNSLIRQSTAKPWEVWTLPDFSVIDDA